MTWSGKSDRETGDEVMSTGKTFESS